MKQQKEKTKKELGIKERGIEIRCPHGYRVTNAKTNASKECWNPECRANG